MPPSDFLILLYIIFFQKKRQFNDKKTTATNKRKIYSAFLQQMVSKLCQLSALRICILYLYVLLIDIPVPPRRTMHKSPICRIIAASMTFGQNKSGLIFINILKKAAENTIIS